MTAAQAVIYVRVSTEEQERGWSLDAQEDECRRYCDTRGLEVVAVFAEAISTKKRVRPEGRLALAQCLVKNGPVLVSVSMDRVARTLSENVELIQAVKKRKLKWATVDMELDASTASGRAALHQRAAFAEFERDIGSERTSRGIRRAQSMGVKFGAQRLVEPELEARVVAMKAGGMSYLRIARQLGREGIKAPRGGTWSRSSLQRIVERNRVEQPAFTPGMVPVP